MRTWLTARGNAKYTDLHTLRHYYASLCLVVHQPKERWRPRIAPKAGAGAAGHLFPTVGGDEDHRLFFRHAMQHGGRKGNKIKVKHRRSVPMIIAIDGPAASGKGTIAKLVAAHYGLAHLDTGSLYRAVARDTLAIGGDPADPSAALASARGLDPSTLDDPELRAPGVGEAASIVAKHPQVRDELLAYQRSFARAKSGAVLDGRDIGTVICPDADVKLFVTATAGERARRRYFELRQAG